MSTARLVARLRHLADELESAERYGVPVPTVVTVDGFELGNVTFSATEDEYDAWVEYAEVEQREYDTAGRHWRSARAVIGEHNLPIAFAVGTSAVAS